MLINHEDFVYNGVSTERLLFIVIWNNINSSYSMLFKVASDFASIYVKLFLIANETKLKDDSHSTRSLSLLMSWFDTCRLLAISNIHQD